MRILIVGQYFWPENFRINEVAAALAEAGCAVSVLTGPPNYPEGVVFAGYSAWKLLRERRDSINIYRVPLIPRGSGSRPRLACNYLSFVVSACAFGPWLLRGQSFDIVLVYAPGPILQSIPALVIGRLKRAAVVTWVQDLWPESLEATQAIRNTRLLGMVSWCVRAIYRRNDLLLVQSVAFVERVRSMAGGTRVVYQPNPGDLPAVDGSVGRTSAVKLNPGFNVVFAGNLGTVQALETILEAAEMNRQLPDLWWVLIGSGSRARWLEGEVRRRGLSQVLLPGRFAPQDMPPILAQASALLVSLVRNPIMSLTVPSKVQAYLAAGRPIVASLDGEGARVVCEARAGIACPAQDAHALSEAVLRLRAMTSQEIDQLGSNGRQYYNAHFDPRTLTAQLMEHLRQVLSVRAPSSADGSTGCAS